jgi:hypothetical protein
LGRRTARRASAGGLPRGGGLREAPFSGCPAGLVAVELRCEEFPAVRSETVELLPGRERVAGPCALSGRPSGTVVVLPPDCGQDRGDGLYLVYASLQDASGPGTVPSHTGARDIPFRVVREEGRL